MEEKKQSECTPQVIAELLRQGKTIVYPTETCYGLGCDATNQKAVDNIFCIKGRNKKKPLLVLVDSIKMAQIYLEWNKKIDDLTKRYWPGALTIVAKVKSNLYLSRGVISDTGFLACRFTDDVFASSIVHALGVPLVSTSANRAGGENPYSAENILSIYKKETIQPDIFIDGGTLLYHKPSTIVQVDGKDIIILRQGDIIFK